MDFTRACARQDWFLALLTEGGKLIQGQRMTDQAIYGLLKKRAVLTPASLVRPYFSLLEQELAGNIQNRYRQESQS